MEVSWGQLVVGVISIILAAVAALCFMKAATISSPLWWVWGQLGGISLTAGSLLMVGALYGRIPLVDISVVPRTVLRPTGTKKRPDTPLLGELLVHEWKLITEEQLETAIDWQQRHGGQLGQALVDLGIISSADLDQVVRRQLGLADPWHQPSVRG